MLVVLAQLMGHAALPFVETKIQTNTDAVLQGVLVGECFCSWSPFLQMEEPHLETIIRKFLLGFVFSCLLVTVQLVLVTSTYTQSGGLNGIQFLWSITFRRKNETISHLFCEKTLCKGGYILRVLYQVISLVFYCRFLGGKGTPGMFNPVL
jgi:hypothetical protein